MNRPLEMSPGWRLMVADAVLLAGALTLAMAPLGEVYPGRRWVLTATLGLVLGVGTTLLARALRCGLLLTALLGALGYLLVGSAAAAPTQAVGGVLPSLDSLRTIVTGVVTSWRSSLTMPLPLDGSRGELVIPFVIALGTGLVATAFLWRTRWPAAAAGAVIAAFVLSAAFGTDTARLPLVRGLLLVVLLLLWLRWRALRRVRTSWPRRVALGLSVAAVAGLAGWGLTAAVAGDSTRDVLRDHVRPPLHRLELKSPLSGYRDFYKRHRDQVLFRIEGLPKTDGDTAVRLATMDSFDGYVWNVSSADLATGTSAFRTAPESRDDDAVELRIEDYDGPWLPTVGRATAATLVKDAGSGGERELLLNSGTGTIYESGGAGKGDAFRLDWQPRPDTEGAVATRADRSVPLAPMAVGEIRPLDELAQKWVSAAHATTDYAVAEALAKGLADDGFFSDGQDPGGEGYSSAGHGAKRLVDMFANDERIVGNDEQYASAMAYAAQRQGLPARVVLGFEDLDANGAVTGDDIAAWVEIPFAGRGWMRFDPTPPENQKPPPVRNSKNDKPQPYVVQPPVLPDEPADVRRIPPEGSGKDLGDKFWDVLLRVLAVLVVLLKVVLLLAPLWLVLLFKGLRRRRRRRAADPLVRLGGAWRELSDHARDLGARVPPGHTRHETGTVLAARFPQSAPTGLAAAADRHVFGPGAPTPEEVDAYWSDVDTALERMRADVPWWRRLLGRFSLASVPWRQAFARGREVVGEIVVMLEGLGRRCLGRLSRRAVRQDRGESS